MGIKNPNTGIIGFWATLLFLFGGLIISIIAILSEFDKYNQIHNTRGIDIKIINERVYGDHKIITSDEEFFLFCVKNRLCKIYLDESNKKIYIKILLTGNFINLLAMFFIFFVCVAIVIINKKSLVKLINEGKIELDTY